MTAPFTPSAQQQALFTTGTFTSHSGELLHWKIDADTLTDEDLATLAAVAARHLPPFRRVYGVPRGGMRLADQLRWRHYMPGSKTLLIVDDVLTTGASMEQARSFFLKEWTTVIGLVIFARGPCPDWVTPMFTLNERFR